MVILSNSLLVVLCAGILVAAWHTFRHAGIVAGFIAARRQASVLAPRGALFISDVRGWFNAIAYSAAQSYRKLKILAPLMCGLLLALAALTHSLPVSISARWFGYLFFVLAAWHFLRAYLEKGHCLKLLHGLAMRNRRMVFFATWGALEVICAVVLLQM